MAKPSKTRSAKKKATKTKGGAARPKLKKAAAKRPASKAAKKATTIAKRPVAKGAKKATAGKVTMAGKRKASKAAKKVRTSPAVYTVSVCDIWSGIQGSQVNFTNPDAITTCHIKEDTSSTWPFTDPSPISVPPAGATTHLKPASELPNATYYYNVDCCMTLTRKSVTVP